MKEKTHQTNPSGMWEWSPNWRGKLRKVIAAISLVYLAYALMQTGSDIIEFIVWPWANP